MRRTIGMLLCLAMLLCGCRIKQHEKNKTAPENGECLQETSGETTIEHDNYGDEIREEELPEDMAVSDANGVEQKKQISVETNDALQQNLEETVVKREETSLTSQDDNETLQPSNYTIDGFLPEDDTPIG